MRHFAKSLVFLALAFVATSAFAQEGQVLTEQTLTIPRNVDFGDKILNRGSYRFVLTDIDGQKWFIIKKGGNEVARDVAIEVPRKELPTSGWQSEVLIGNDYYRIRVRQGDSVYILHLLFEGAQGS